MITRKPSEKTLSFLLLGATLLIGITHVWYPITVSPPNLSDRISVPFITASFVMLIILGYRWARISIGFIYVFFAAVNSLIVQAYFTTMKFNQLAQIGSLILLLGATGILLLTWKGVRIFEDEREKQRLTDI